jgi:hypothetical protein
MKFSDIMALLLAIMTFLIANLTPLMPLLHIKCVKMAFFMFGIKFINNKV